MLLGNHISHDDAGSSLFSFVFYFPKRPKWISVLPHIIYMYVSIRTIQYYTNITPIFTLLWADMLNWFIKNPKKRGHFPKLFYTGLFIEVTRAKIETFWLFGHHQCVWLLNWHRAKSHWIINWNALTHITWIYVQISHRHECSVGKYNYSAHGAGLGQRNQDQSERARECNGEKLTTRHQSSHDSNALRMKAVGSLLPWRVKGTFCIPSQMSLCREGPWGSG